VLFRRIETTTALKMAIYLNFAQTNGNLLKGENGSQSGLDVSGKRIS
jgi:hypothetical protein